MPATDHKAAFLEFLPEHAKETRARFPQAWFKMATATALAQFSISGATTEEMAGARKFLEILTNIGERPEEIQRLPVVTLEHLDK